MTLKKRIAIWGAGVRGREAYYTLKTKFQVVGFLDSDINKMGMEIADGKRVLEQETNNKNVFIVIACDKWMEVSQALKEKDLNFLIDFIPYHMLLKKNIRVDELLDHFGANDTLLYLNEVKKERKIALIYGNCQTVIMANMLEYNREFAEQYMLLRVPQIHLYRDKEQIEQIFYLNHIMELIDLFIYQNVKEDNRFYPRLGTDTLLKQVSNECRKMPIHNIYFDGYFIQSDINGDEYWENFVHNDFPYCDRIVDTFLTEGKNVDEIIKLIEDTDLIPTCEIVKHCEISIQNLRQREKLVEIPIVDYIEENYRNERLFYSPNHPKDSVIYEYVRRILAAIGIRYTDEFSEEELNMEFGALSVCIFPVFPCVLKALGLKKHEYKMRISNVSPKLVSMEDYIREYIYRCYKMDR